MKRNTLSTMSVYSLSLLTSRTSSSSYSSNNGDRESQGDEEEEEDSFETEREPEREERNTVKWVLSNEAYCFDMRKFSEKLVQATLIEASRYLSFKEKERIIRSSDVVSPIIYDLLKRIPKTESRPDKVEPRASTKTTEETGADEAYSDWPKISEFNIKVGLDRVEDYVSRWTRADDWMFCVEFLGFESEDCSNVFVYEVEWSKPTKEYPIPQATASVYFAMEVFKMVPYNYDRNVEVTYVFESSTIIHSPGKIDFQEKWLYDIINAKLKFFKTVTFGTPEGEKDCEKEFMLRENMLDPDLVPRF